MRYCFALVAVSAGRRLFILSLLILTLPLYDSFSPQVRVFTFSVGQHNYDVTPLQWIACANKGKLIIYQRTCFCVKYERETWILAVAQFSRLPYLCFGSLGY